MAERSSLATLASMPEDDFVELVWENGRIHLRGRSARTQKGPSRTADSLYPSNAQAEHGEETHTKRARSETTPSILNLSALSGFTDHRNSDLNFTGNNSSQSGYYLDSSTQLHQSNLDGNISRRADKHPGLGTSRKSQLDPSSSQNQASRSIIRPGLNRVSMSALQTSNLMDKKTSAVNFSNLRPAALLKANSQGSDVTRPTYSKDFTGVQKSKRGNVKTAALGSSNPLGPAVVEPAIVPKTATALQNRPQADMMPSAGKSKESLPDDHSKASRRGNHKSRVELLCQTPSLAANTPTVKPNTKKFTEPPVASTSVRSLGASNDPTYSLRRTYEVTEESAYSIEVIRRNVEEPHGFRKQGLARGGTRAKRKRSAEVHNLSERKRREKFNKKMRVLRQLIPNCNKVDKASMLDEAIQYLKTLQLQLQIMSMGSGLCIPQMMLPTMMQHISAPPLTHFSPMGAGMGMRMGSGISCNPGQFAPSELGATVLPEITGTRYQMLGFPMSFMPSVGRPTTETVPVPAFPGAAPLVEHLGSTPLTCPKDSNEHINSEMKNNAKTKCSKIPTYAFSSFFTLPQGMAPQPNIDQNLE